MSAKREPAKDCIDTLEIGRGAQRVVPEPAAHLVYQPAQEPEVGEKQAPEAAPAVEKVEPAPAKFEKGQTVYRSAS